MHSSVSVVPTEFRRQLTAIRFDGGRLLSAKDDIRLSSLQRAAAMVGRRVTVIHAERLEAHDVSSGLLRRLLG